MADKSTPSAKHQPDVIGYEDLQKDLTGTHKLENYERKADPADVERDWQALQRDGYVILERLIPEAECDRIKQVLLPLLSHTGRNEFEGKATQRLYSVLTKTRACDRLVDHPRILALLDRMFRPNYLLSQLQVINILPGETGQYLHPDDSFYPVARPRPPMGAATVWAIDDFTAENGATNIVPGSETWGDDRQPTDDDKRIQAVMPKGSVVFYGGTLWHGGGENRSDASRLAVTAQYCEPWCRTQENYFLSTPKEIVRTLTPELQTMLGYSVMPPFMGMVNGMHPKRVLAEG
ncbi:phytanoyl-CoA dioxygenase family protein [Parvularcula flava]|uniref:Phytanoyl-CoA dioxygenase family protein n=1 Tax=Aquisalinus luteolus TaxID=1566827 RepID=A0A8J3EP34_9PROT|nr:phytanoyl-CoA dioxygenase family protein [Aquisalinus luteolus]NHK26978.1 phytanoyl-CoA dioxygenase family protein [Aquisalinus luteolus]GGH93992.1 hypothetical protein GCM10011355_07130 [Aquisalinus luteolus]